MIVVALSRKVEVPGREESPYRLQFYVNKSGDLDRLGRDGGLLQLAIVNPLR